ncbi:MAG: adenylate cyclase, partial [Desulfobacteraceae bacterium]|nr:adenylate cyclase [Desulfobacteraceae bacterium]
FGLRKILLQKCIKKWNWDKERIYEIGGFKEWQYHNIVRLSATIEKYMIKKYKKVSKTFDRNFHERAMISAEDRTVLGRKVWIEFSKQPGKIGKVLLVSRGDRHFQGLNLKYELKQGKTPQWYLINKSSKQIYSEEALYVASTIEEIGAWMINNSLYTEHTLINLIPNPTYVTYDDIKKLYKAMYDFFHSDLKENVSFKELLVKDKIVSLFISINLYASKNLKNVMEYSAIYMNSWGEMFCKSCISKSGFSNMDEMKRDVCQQIKMGRLPENTAFYFPKGILR